MAVCDVCFRHCGIPEGKRGYCGARTSEGGIVVPVNYGLISSAALDPIEKKPLKRFCPGSVIFSVGSFGCNLSCPFCQNHEISHPEGPEAPEEMCRRAAPEELVRAALRLRDKGNIGIAFT